MAGYRGRRRGWAVGIAAITASTGCGDDVAPVEGCVQAVCDIYDPACVKATTEGVGCHLELATIAPRVRYSFAEEVVAELEAANALSPEEEAERDDVLRAVSLVGLMPPNYEPEDLVADGVAQILAYYDPKEDRITIIRDTSLSPDVQHYVLAHELVHAYRDVEHDLIAFEEKFATTRDRFVGTRSVMEGDATIHGLLILGEAKQSTPDLGAATKSIKASALETFQATETPFLDMIDAFPYGYGGAFVRSAWREGGHGAVAELYASPPDSVRQVVGGYDSWPDELVNAETELDGRDVPDLGEGYSLIHYTHQGIWMLNAMLLRMTGSTPWEEGPMGVGADALVVLREEATDELVLTWRIVVSEEERATMLELLLATSTWALAEPGADPTRFIVAEIDGDLVLLATTPGLSPIEVFESMQGWTSPDTFEEGESADMAAPASLTEDLLVYRRSDL